MIPPFVDLDWIDSFTDNGRRLVLADVRWYMDGRSGLEAYEQGHLPDAVYVDLDKWLAGDPRTGHGRHPLPDPVVFAEGMSRAGISDDSVVVAYDDQGGVIAARLVWMLRATGHDAALLDGGLFAYSGVTQRGNASPSLGHFTPLPWPEARLATIDDATDLGNVVVDARAPDRYNGSTEPVDPRAGHIPRAWNVPCRENLNPDGTLRPLTELRQRFAAVGAVPGRTVVSYCGSGVTACHSLLVMEQCGFGEGFGRLYAGSWSEYSSDSDRPAATTDRL
jgi:thiosulfate/3-mercaptopyruvate sulfurtransferase